MLTLAASLALAAPASGATLHDQYDQASAASTSSWVSDPGNDYLVADDFVVPDGRRWSIERVDADGTTHALGASSVFKVRFFGTVGQLPQETEIVKRENLSATAGTTSPDPGLVLNPPVVLEPGRYWLAIQGEASLTITSWEWVNRSSQKGYAAAYRASSCGLCATQCTTWRVRAGSCNNPAGNPDQVFRILGTETVIPPGAAPAAPDSTAPAFTGTPPKASPASFAVDAAGAGEVKVGRAPVKKGTTFRYSLSEAAGVTFTVQRRGRGRRVGRSCKKPTRANRKRRKCTRYTRVGAFRHQGAAGSNSKRFSGKIGRKALRPGRYRALLVAVDAAGNRSAERRVRFRVVKPSPKRRRGR